MAKDGHWYVFDAIPVYELDQVLLTAHQWYDFHKKQQIGARDRFIFSILPRDQMTLVDKGYSKANVSLLGKTATKEVNGMLLSLGIKLN